MIPILIPAYQPGSGLIETIAALQQMGFTRIVIVDDGSSPPHAAIFEEAKARGATLLRHAVNLGKGAALKTGLNYILLTWPDAAGAVTADADGQHDPADIAAVARELAEHPDSLVLGARSFDRDVPARSLAGNRLTGFLMRALAGMRLADTQTGLRGIPSGLAPELLKITTQGYEFELEMLLTSKQKDVPIREIPIRTIYLDGNISSHFNPVRDSMLIYFVLMRFTMVSLITAILDNSVFALSYRLTGNILGSQALGRTVAVIFNYFTARRAVFHSGERHKQVLPKYLLLVLVNTAISYLMITLLHARYGVRVIVAKVSIEGLLFLGNFAIQRDLIFRKRRVYSTVQTPPSR